MVLVIVFVLLRRRFYLVTAQQVKHMVNASKRFILLIVRDIGKGSQVWKMMPMPIPMTVQLHKGKG